ncbi:hypothetical protein [Flavobacterium sp. ACN6]|uniref:hypothetical protein n=1 Tax=Flavobacterium sp. ACN6 TaxID=1920426 RepID=UPI001144DB29|nr:hypothetical protein [Flavobacterium sp. ACN6]PBJ13867.1 hypothetical protein BSF42_13460 [Flavobacterium sp. ACN6]
MKLSHKNRFYLDLLFEIILSPISYMNNFLKWHFGNIENKEVLTKKRKSVNQNKVSVCIHEWGGYEGKRLKKIKNIPEFECGLDYQLERFQNYSGQYDLNLSITISELNLFKSKINNVEMIEVPNEGMDFSGYEAFFNKIKSEENQYVILTNSSVNKYQVNFIDDYISFFKENSSIGMMGISFNSKMYQSLIKNNFNPHLQSFFLLTTTQVLKEVVDFNNGFPGKGIDYKLELIKKGEIKLSKIVLDMGYTLACVLENGKPFLFDKSHFIDNGRNSWKNFYGDYRLHTRKPNAINSLKLGVK